MFRLFCGLAFGDKIEANDWIFVTRTVPSSELWRGINRLLTVAIRNIRTHESNTNASSYAATASNERRYL